MFNVRDVDSPGCILKGEIRLWEISFYIRSAWVEMEKVLHGAAQHAKDSGIRDEQIQARGRWTSSSVNLYFTTSPALLYSYSFQFQTSKPLPFTNTSTLWAQASHATPVVAS